MTTHLLENQATERAAVGSDKFSSPVNLFYLVNREALSSIFAAQVLAPLSRHGEEVNVRLGVLTPLGHRLRPVWRRRMAEVCRLAAETYGISMTCLTAPPARWRRLWNDARTLRRWLRRQQPTDAPMLLHCRNAEMTEVALEAARGMSDVRVLFDSRGAEVEEFLQEHGLDVAETSQWPPRHRQRFEELVARQRRVLREATHVFCVSQAMRQQLVETYGLDPAKSTVVPCCPDVERFVVPAEVRREARRKLGLEDKLVVTYCGSMAWYQLPEQALRIFRLIAARQSQAHFLAVTTQPQIMQAAIARVGIDEWQTSVVSVPPQEVPAFLAAGDVGLLLRDDSVVNRVASPVKFGEYLAAGLPVIVSDGLGDYSEVVRRHGLGSVVSLRDSDAALQECLGTLTASGEFTSGGMRERCRSYAVDELSWSKHLERIVDVYRALSASVAE